MVQSRTMAPNVKLRADLHKALKLRAVDKGASLESELAAAVEQYLGKAEGYVEIPFSPQVKRDPEKLETAVKALKDKPELPEEDEPEVAAPVRHEVKLRGAWNGYDEVTGEEYALPIFWVDGRWIDSKDTELPYQVADQLARLLRTKKISLEGLE